MSQYRCMYCGSPNVVTQREKDGFSYTKAIEGTIVFGAVGAVAGVNGKEKTVYKCRDCGMTADSPMLPKLQAMIDLGVDIPGARERLEVDGLKIEWDVLKKQYKNIESGYADDFIKSRKEDIATVLNKRATASKAVFDKAVDTVKENNHNAYPQETMTAEKYSTFLDAIVIVIENLYKYIPPQAFKRGEFTYAEEIEYRNVKIELQDWFNLYVYIVYYRDNGKFISLTEPEKKVKEFFKDPFLQSFYKAYVDILWRDWNRPMYGTRTTLDLTEDKCAEKMVEKLGRTSIGSGGVARVAVLLIHVKLKEIAELKELVEINYPFQHIFSAAIGIPKYIIKDGRLCIIKNHKNLRYNDLDHIIREYFKHFPKKKREYEKMLSEWKKEAEEYVSLKAQYKELQEKMKKDPNKVIAGKQAALSTKIKNKEEMQKKVESLEKKRFGKKKAEIKIQELSVCIKETDTKIKALERDIAALKRDYEEAEPLSKILEAKMRAHETDKDFALRLFEKFDNFVIWEQV